MGVLIFIALLPFTMHAGEFVTLTNQNGIAVRAMILDRQGDGLTIKREDGAEFVIKISSLSEESQKIASSWEAAVFLVQVYPPVDTSKKDRLSQTRFVVKGPHTTALGFFPDEIPELKEGISECVKLRAKIENITTGQTVSIPLQKVNEKFVKPSASFYREPTDRRWLIILDADKRLISLPIKFAATDFDPDPQLGVDPKADPFAPLGRGGRLSREATRRRDARPLPYGLADEWLYFFTKFNPQDQLAQFDRIKQIGDGL
jgi:hypothetical protein